MKDPKEIKKIFKLFHLLAGCYGTMLIFGAHGVYCDLGYFGIALWGLVCLATYFAMLALWKDLVK
jgi:hypothetical protein